MDLRQTPKYSEFLRGIGWIIEKDAKSGAFIFIRKLPLTGFSVIKIQRASRLPNKSVLDRLIKKYRAIQLNIEPEGDNDIPLLVAWKMHRQTIPFLPSTTIILDLRLPFKTLLALMKQKTRYNLTLSAKKKVLVKISDGSALIQDPFLFEAMFAMQKQNAKRLGIFVLPKKWFAKQVKALGKHCFAAMAYVDEELVAATFYMTSDDAVYYAHNGSTELGRKLFAPTACVVAGILEGQKRKLKAFDFEGIYDPRSKVIRWQGFTRFKKGFGGGVEMTPGLYSKWIWPF